MTKWAPIALALCAFSVVLKAQPKPVFQTFVTGLTNGSDPFAITAGPDGALWFTELSGNRIGRISPGGQIQEMALPSGARPYTITSGPDGALWFTEAGAGRIGRITIAGAVTEYPIAGAPRYITAGPDGALWFGEAGNLEHCPVIRIGADADQNRRHQCDGQRKTCVRLLLLQRCHEPRLPAGSDQRAGASRQRARIGARRGDQSLYLHAAVSGEREECRAVVPVVQFLPRVM